MGRKTSETIFFIIHGICKQSFGISICFCGTAFFLGFTHQISNHLFQTSWSLRLTEISVLMQTILGLTSFVKLQTQIQESSRRPPRAAQEALSRPTLGNRPPRDLQEASKASLGPIGTSPRLLQRNPRAPEKSPRAPLRGLPEASASKLPSIQDRNLCF